MWLLTSSSSLFYPSFLVAATLGSILALSSTNWFLIWVGLEINMYSFIPLLLHLDMNKRKESAAKYFLAQATGSILLLMATLSMYSQPMAAGTMFLTAILLKGGFAPLHYWYPSIMVTSTWMTCLLLSTIQKMAPIILLISFTPTNSYLLVMLGSLMILVGGIGGINQTQLRAILAYSSIAQMGWITMAAQLSTSINLLMLMNYMVTVATIMMIMNYNEWFTGNEPTMFWGSHTTTKFMLMFQLMSLGGIPPFTGFIFKALIISKLMTMNLISSVMIAILGSMLSLYFYLKIIFFSLFNSTNSSTLNNFYTPTNLKSLTLLMVIISTFPIIIFMFPWLLI